MIINVKSTVVPDCDFLGSRNEITWDSFELNINHFKTISYPTPLTTSCGTVSK